MAKDKEWKTFVCVCHNTGKTRSFTGFSKERVRSEVRSNDDCCRALLMKGEFEGRITIVELNKEGKPSIEFV